MKKKVALCLHGYFNSFTDSSSKGVDGFNYLKKKVFDLPNVTVDVFIHSWDIEHQEEIESLYIPEYSMFEEQYSFDNLIRSYGLSNVSTPRSPLAVISHLYSVAKVMRAAFLKPYDIFIKARFDIGRINRMSSGPGKPNPYPVQCINFDPELVTKNPGAIMMANWQYYNDGPPDMWFYGDYEAMRPFSTLDLSVIEDLMPGSRFRQDANTMDEVVNAIRLYKSFLKKHNRWDNRVMLPTEWE